MLSQAGEGWTASAVTYDDGGFSGGSMERPGLKALMADVDAGRIDVVVVYKVDRLTRALTDFARIVERFDAKGVSFVSVTQAFNTTTSMGRLTLNVLLSFAQFEREVTGERIRDKIALSKARGMWMGGAAPLGYDGHDRTLRINEAEAETVRHIYARYLALGSVHRLRDELEAQGRGHQALRLTRTAAGAAAVRSSAGPCSTSCPTAPTSARSATASSPTRGCTRPSSTRTPSTRCRRSWRARRGRSAGPGRVSPRTPRPHRSPGSCTTTPGTECPRWARARRAGRPTATSSPPPFLKGRADQAGSLPRFPAAELEALIADRLRRLGLDDAATAVNRIEVGRETVRMHPASQASGRPGCSGTAGRRRAHDLPRRCSPS